MDQWSTHACRQRYTQVQFNGQARLFFAQQEVEEILQGKHTADTAVHGTGLLSERSAAHLLSAAAHS